MCCLDCVKKFQRAKGGMVTTFNNLRLVTWTQASSCPPQIFGQVYTYAHIVSIIATLVFETTYYVSSEMLNLAK